MLPDMDAAPSRGRRRGDRWTRISRGLYVPSTQASPTVDPTLPGWQLVLPPAAAFTHLTAAREYGWWLPPLPDDVPVFADAVQGGSWPRRSGLKVTRHPTPIASVRRDGIRLATPTESVLACARDLGLLDLVVVLDAALHLGACTLSELHEAAARRRRGAPLLRRALLLADGRSESAYESLLRVLHVVCGVPVKPQHEVRDGGGVLVARGDLWIVGTTTLHEYDGGNHLARARQRRDLRRERAIGHATWTRRGYVKEDVLTQGVGILRDADASLGRPHRPERIRAWHALLGQSLFTSAGTARLRARLGLALPPTVHERPPIGA